jgi:tRNA (uracil-5-)-methyltransferase TRM9
MSFSRDFSIMKTYNEGMQASTANQLIALNRRFYQKLAAPFSKTRGRLQMGVLKSLEVLDRHARVLDLGCGNGQLALELEKRGHQGPYVGVDFSEELLQIAREKNYDNSKARFDLADLSANDWAKDFGEKSFDIIFCFSSLHHIPGRDMRLLFLQQVRELLSLEGRFLHSNWQFLNSDKLRQRIQDWSKAGLTDADMDDGDHLLDWRSGGEGLRYAHHFSEEELSELAEASAFHVLDTFASDGATGNLGLYGVWQAMDKIT